MNYKIKSTHSEIIENIESKEFKRMQKLAGLIVEEKQTYDFGCAMLYFNFPEMNKIHDDIDQFGQNEDLMSGDNQKNKR